MIQLDSCSVAQILRSLSSRSNFLLCLNQSQRGRWGVVINCDKIDLIEISSSSGRSDTVSHVYWQ